MMEQERKVIGGRIWNDLSGYREWIGMKDQEGEFSPYLVWSISFL